MGYAVNVYAIPANDYRRGHPGCILFESKSERPPMKYVVNLSQQVFGAVRPYQHQQALFSGYGGIDGHMTFGTYLRLIHPKFLELYPQVKDENVGMSDILFALYGPVWTWTQIRSERYCILTLSVATTRFYFCCFPSTIRTKFSYAIIRTIVYCLRRFFL